MIGLSEDKGLVRAPGRITPEQYKFLEELVDQGRFSSKSEALRATIDSFNEKAS
jgi:Arc/MetJ-type ribon-helix-helix transcriptional regulator